MPLLKADWPVPSRFRRMRICVSEVWRCTSAIRSVWGAAVISRAYRGGSKNDWYLPSAGELNEICKFAHFQITGDPKVVCAESRVRRSGFENYYYWSSFETEPQFASLQNFTLGERSGGGSKKALCRVRPVRAF